MRINYIGMSDNFNYRIAEITWKDYDEKENILAERIADFMDKVHGYNMVISCKGYASIEVENFQQYKEIVSIYKEAKKMFIDCMKYGF